jgi:hypothetical protein
MSAHSFRTPDVQRALANAGARSQSPVGAAVAAGAAS